MGVLPHSASIGSFRRMRKEARWKRALPDSKNRFREMPSFRFTFRGDAQMTRRPDPTVSWQDACWSGSPVPFHGKTPRPLPDNKRMRLTV